MALTSEEIKQMQKASKRQEPAKPTSGKPPRPSMIKPYLNIIREDITHLLTMFSSGYLYRKEQEQKYRDFMEHHFPGMK